MVRSKSRDLPSILVSNDPQLKIRFKKIPDLHKRFLMEVCSLIVNTAELAHFAKGCGISDYIISRAALDNMGNDGECIEQALCQWWMSSNIHLCQRAHKIKLGFDQLDCPGLFGTLLDRYPELDSTSSKKYTCRVCTKVYFSIGHYNEHLKVHSGSHFICPWCSKSFQHKKNLHAHQQGACAKRPDDQPVPERHQCDYCYKSYAHKRDLQAHIKQKHPSQQ